MRAKRREINLFHPLNRFLGFLNIDKKKLRTTFFAMSMPQRHFSLFTIELYDNDDEKIFILILNRWPSTGNDHQVEDF